MRSISTFVNNNNNNNIDSRLLVWTIHQSCGHSLVSTPWTSPRHNLLWSIDRHVVLWLFICRVSHFASANFFTGIIFVMIIIYFIYLHLVAACSRKDRDGRDGAYRAVSGLSHWGEHAQLAHAPILKAFPENRPVWSISFLFFFFLSSWWLIFFLSTATHLSDQHYLNV